MPPPETDSNLNSKQIVEGGHTLLIAEPFRTTVVIQLILKTFVQGPLLIREKLYCITITSPLHAYFAF